MDADHMAILALEERPEKFESIIVEQQKQCASNPALASLLDSIYLESDRALAFERFRGGYEFRTIEKLLGLFRVGRESRLCEIGGGPGFLSWALLQAGFTHLGLLEPNPHFNTGTGYLRTRPDAAGIIIHNDLVSWHATADRYDAVITKNCIHHFPNIAQSAAAIRQKMNNGSLWFSFREWFAETPAELYRQLAGHPYCQPYGMYEWPFPAWHYAEAIEIAGFRLKAVVPAAYANNCLGTFQEQEGNDAVRWFTAQIDHALTADPAITVRTFWQEMLNNRFRGGNTRLFTRPQLMVFERVPI
jgi:hypothetical protein